MTSMRWVQAIVHNFSFFFLNFYYNIKLQLYYFSNIFEGWNVQVIQKHDLPPCDVLATFGTYFPLKGPSIR